MLNEPPSVTSEFELMLAHAFDLAWERFIGLEGAEANTAENRGALAARIVVLAKLGEADATRIGDAALLYLRALAAAKRLSGADRQRDVMTTLSPGAVLDQDAIGAATAAFDACLDELPEGIPAGARSTLLQAILEKAGQGERDGDRLRDHALEALKSRE
jgi:hypothetical protein